MTILPRKGNSDTGYVKLKLTLEAIRMGKKMVQKYHRQRIKVSKTLFNYMAGY